MTGGSAEAAIEAASKNVAEVLVGSEDISRAEKLQEGKLLAAINANPVMDAKSVAKQILRDAKPKVKARGLQEVAVSLDPNLAKNFIDAFKHLADTLKLKGESALQVRQALRTAFDQSRAPLSETNDDFQNRDVKLLMQEISAHVKDPEVKAAARKVCAAHDAMLIANEESDAEHRATRGMSVNVGTRDWEWT